MRVQHTWRFLTEPERAVFSDATALGIRASLQTRMHRHVSIADLFLGFWCYCVSETGPSRLNRHGASRRGLRPFSFRKEGEKVSRSLSVQKRAGGAQRLPAIQGKISRFHGLWPQMSAS
jgi:hypothetical protein